MRSVAVICVCCLASCSLFFSDSTGAGADAGLDAPIDAGVELIPCLPVPLLTDDFEDDVVGAQWGPAFGASGATEANGRLRVQITSGGGGIRSVAPLDLRGGEVVVDVDFVTAGDGSIANVALTQSAAKTGPTYFATVGYRSSEEVTEDTGTDLSVLTTLPMRSAAFRGLVRMRLADYVVIFESKAPGEALFSTHGEGPVQGDSERVSASLQASIGTSATTTTVDFYDFKATRPPESGWCPARDLQLDVKSEDLFNRLAEVVTVGGSASFDDTGIVLSPASPTLTEIGVLSRGRYGVAGGSVTVELKSSDSEFLFGIELRVSSEQRIGLEMDPNSAFGPRTVVGYVKSPGAIRTEVAGPTFDLDVHRFFRVTVAGEKVLFETSEDGMNFDGLPNTLSTNGIPLEAAQLLVYAVLGEPSLLSIGSIEGADAP